jgi:hypothetical protein
MADDTVDGITRAPVESSNIHSIGYDETRRVLAVGFNSGAIFHYSHVDKGTWERFVTAPSKGSFFYRHVKGRFSAEKMTGPCPMCGDQGVVGMTCTDCGTDTYRKEERRYGESNQAAG